MTPGPFPWLAHRRMRAHRGTERLQVRSDVAHLTTPLDHRNPTGLVSASDIHVITGGASTNGPGVIWKSTLLS